MDFSDIKYQISLFAQVEKKRKISITEPSDFIILFFRQYLLYKYVEYCVANMMFRNIIM